MLQFPIKNLTGTQSLLTEAMARDIPKIGGQENVTDAIAHFKFFTPAGSWTWYMTELDQTTGEAFGKVFSSLCPDGEWGTFLLANDEYPEESLAGIKANGMAIERDAHFQPTPMSQCK